MQSTLLERLDPQQIQSRKRVVRISFALLYVFHSHAVALGPQSRETCSHSLACRVYPQLCLATPRNRQPEIRIKVCRRRLISHVLSYFLQNMVKCAKRQIIREGASSFEGCRCSIPIVYAAWLALTRCHATRHKETINVFFNLNVLCVRIALLPLVTQ